MSLYIPGKTISNKNTWQIAGKTEILIIRGIKMKYLMPFIFAKLKREFPNLLVYTGTSAREILVTIQPLIKCEDF